MSATLKQVTVTFTPEGALEYAVRYAHTEEQTP